MKFDWTVEKVDFMGKISEAVKKQEDLDKLKNKYKSNGARCRYV